MGATTLNIITLNITTLYIITLGIITFNIMGLNATLSINNTKSTTVNIACYCVMSAVGLNAVVASVVMLNVVASGANVIKQYRGKLPW